MMKESGANDEDLAAQVRQILEQAERHNVTLRVVGGLAIHIRCPDYNYIQRDCGRTFKDIDFGGYFAQLRETEAVFHELGFSEDRELKTVPGVRRSIFRHPEHAWDVDVFYDVLEFSHDIDLKGRLELDRTTIPVVDLLLQKLQIVQINEKDVIDALVLLRQHEVDGDGIDADRLARVCKRDWGLWRTATGNLHKLLTLAGDYSILTQADRHTIRNRIEALQRRISNEPATVRWKLRSRIGERVKWYRDVDEVM